MNTKRLRLDYTLVHMMISRTIMASIISLIFLMLGVNDIVQSQKLDLTTVNDGPYIFIEGDEYRYKNISAGRLTDTLVRVGDPFLPPIFPIDRKKAKKWKYKNVPKFIALSDIHGQYDIMIQLLEAHHVIDSIGQWLYGEGHLVIVGDIFDRGDQVTQILWFLYELEQKALEKGGKVHVLLGNHELMALGGDTRYVHKSYRYTRVLTKTQYHELFGSQTVLGQWLRSKNVILILDKHAFVHAGISPELAKANIPPEKINDFFKKDILDKTEEEIYSDDLLGYLYSDNGPVWYRNYADSLFTVKDYLPILKYLKVKHIVVGHTSYEQVESRFNNKLIFVDSSIKLGDRGELLIFQNGKHYRGDLNGNKIEL